MITLCSRCIQRASAQVVCANMPAGISYGRGLARAIEIDEVRILTIRFKGKMELPLKELLQEHTSSHAICLPISLLRTL